MTTTQRPDPKTELSTTSQLRDFLASGARPEADWGIGAESEKLIVDAVTGEAADYPRIEQLLEQIARTGSWREVREQGHLVALIGEQSSVTLEPGGQIELSGRLCQDIHCCEGDFASHVRQVVAAAEPLGLICLGLGAQPFTPLGQIAWLPKARYGIMGPYMLRSGSLGQAMMKQTAGLQVNLDFLDEADCMRKLRLGQYLAPLLYAMFANSPVMEGRPLGFQSIRGEIWTHTDADRTGLIPALFADDACFESYIDYALDVPMYFLIRDGKYLDLTRERFSFRRFLQEGYAGHRPLMGDWDLHLSTLFTEVRLRPQIEFRTADALPPHMTLAVAALLKGIFYDRSALQATLDLFTGQTPESAMNAYQQSWRLGLQAHYGTRSFQELAVELVALAAQGLVRQQQRNQSGLDESVFLRQLTELVNSGTTLAQRLLQQWSGDRQRDLATLKQHCGFF